MPKLKLTTEQEAVINHPQGYHARVLAVAGSGKTTTMAYRIQYLVMERQVSPSAIRVLMFNKLAREQFCERLVEIGLPAELHPKVNTFHSFAYQFMRDLISKGKLAYDLDEWLSEKSELILYTVHQAIDNLIKQDIVEEDEIDPKEVMEAISLWKGSLIPPDRAGYRGNSNIPLVYSEFERLRILKRGLTYDDFVPMAVAYLENDPTIKKEWCGKAHYLIVDEYQDINYGQQRLIELLAGNNSEIMVVGDDDQTIYEWRGARPNYIIRKFRTEFDNKPHIDYKLSRSFRFGPVIAQCAHNAISFNTTRVEKHLVSRFIEKPAEFQIIECLPGQKTDANRELTQQLTALIKSRKAAPNRVAVLCRMFAQLAGIQSQFLAHKVPFRVIGQSPFWNRREIRVLLNYIQFANHLDLTVTQISRDWLLSFANTPSRKLRRADLSQLMDRAYQQKLSNKQALRMLVDNPDTPLYRSQQERVEELIDFLAEVNYRIKQPSSSMAMLLDWMVDRLDYLAHFDNYYGDGEESYDRKETVRTFIQFSREMNQPSLQLIETLSKLDSTQGAPEEHQIMMTTIFRTKGLEYDYVFIPECDEGFLPCLYRSSCFIYDTTGQVREPEASEAIENERRLFYVAITRAKNGVYIGATGPWSGSQNTSRNPHASRFLEEMQFQPTWEIMNPLQKVAAKDGMAENEFLQAVSKYGGKKHIMQLLLSEYLVDLQNSDLISKVSAIVAASTEMPFRYRHAFSSKKLENARKDDEHQEPLHHAWEDVDF